jgi:uncharacterized protein YeaO (DUF488 family)
MRPVPPLDVRIRRVYDEPSAADGTRVLVDRIWPRGLRKDVIQLDDWAKDAAPSTELRTWYGHDPAKFEEFRRRYLGELAGSTQRAALGRLRALATTGRPLTLLTATRDLDHSQAAVLAWLLRQSAEEGGEAARLDARLDEGAQAGDRAADDQRVDLPGALVGVDRLGVGHEP